jgi:hypothetical protein
MAQFKPIALVDDEPSFQPVALADEAVTFQPVAEEPSIAPAAQKRIDKATPRRYKSIAFTPFGKIEQTISSEDVAKAPVQKNAGLVRDENGNIVGEQGVQETLTEPKNMAIGTAGTLVGGTVLGAAGLRAGGAIGKALSGALETTVPIELASTLTGGISDVGRMAKSAVKGVFKPKAIVSEIPTTPAAKVEAMYDASEEAFTALRKPKIEKILKTAKSRIVDASGNVKDELLKLGPEGKDVVVRHNLARGASSITDMELQGYRSAIYDGLDAADEKTLNRIISSRRTTTVADYKPEIKSTAGLTPDDHRAYLNDIAARDPEKYAVLNQRADEYFKTMRGQLDKLYSEGLVSEKSYKALVDSGDYSPRKFIQYVDPDSSYSFGGKQISVPSSGIKRLKEGSEEALETNSRLLMAEVVARTNARIMKNRANKELFNLAKAKPDNGLVKTWDDAPAPGGFERVSVMVNGKQEGMILPSEYAKEWVLSDPQISKELAGTIGWLSGGKILKPMATGLNPEFALTNFARDLAHIYLTTDEYSSFLPRAMAQQAVDLAATAKDAVLRKGAYNRYVMQGGGMEFLTHQGRPGKVGTAMDNLYRVMGYLGETTEIWSRLALRRRALTNAVRQGVKPEMAELYATNSARDYLDFSQGGSFIKAMDTGIPYLNAAVQATRGIGRAAIDKPGLFAMKAGQIGAMATGIYYANRFTNPEAWEQIPDREKAGNFIITTPLSYYDKNGDKRHLYFKIAKDQSQRIFATIFENMAAMAIGDKFSLKQLGQAFEDAMPIVPTGMMPPTFEAMLGYAANKNFWRNEDIWRGPKDIEASEEWTRYTPEAYKQFGKATGMSPERTKYALEQVFTSGNVWTSLTGLGMSAMLKELPKDVRDQTMNEIVSKQPFIRKVMKSTDPYAKYADDIGEMRTEAATKRLRGKREFEGKAEEYIRGNASREEVMAYIMEQPPEQRRNLVRKFNDYNRMGNMPDKKWWIDLKYSDPDTRAELFYRRYEKAKSDEKERMMQWLNRLPGIRSDQFNRRLYQLQREK